jgi:hypothetical protein
MTQDKGKRKSVIWLLISRLFGFVLFLVMIAGANALTIFIMNPLFHQVVQFLNKNIVLLIVMFVIFLIGEVFNAFIFPFVLLGGYSWLFARLSETHKSDNA